MPFIQQQLIADGVTADGRNVVPKAVLEIITNDNVDTIAVNVGGTGYQVGDTFELATGTAVAINGASITAKGRVAAVSSGVVTAIDLFSAGAYTADPTLTAGATTTLTGAGSGLTVDVTMQAAIWTQDAEANFSLTQESPDYEWLATSSKSSKPPTIGMRGQLSSSNDGIRLLVGSGYDSGATWTAQPGVSTSLTSYVAVPNQDPEIFVSVSERRVNVLITDDGRNQKQYCGLGLFIPFVDVASNYPFPAIMHGQATSVRAFSEGFNTANRGVLWPIDIGASALGPYQYRDNLSTTWFGISDDNNNGGDTARAQMWPSNSDDESRYDFNFAPVPTGSSASTANMSPFNGSEPTGSFVEDTASTAWWNSNESTAGAQGPAPLGTNSQLHFMMQPHIIANQVDDVQPIGILDGWRNIHGRGLAAFEEIENANGDRFIVFNDTDSTAVYQWVAMEIV